jgi:hypothetical protein
MYLDSIANFVLKRLRIILLIEYYIRRLLMSRFKVGDKVMYIKHMDEAKDPYYFKLRGIYTIKEISKYNISFTEVHMTANKRQVTPIFEVNAIIKLLYPDYIEEDGYLVPEERYNLGPLRYYKLRRGFI